jgi:hypothetical protein
MEIQDTLREFLKNIINQSIILKYIKFEANTNIEGNFLEGNLARTLQLEEVKIRGADIKPVFEEKEDKTAKALIIEYHGILKDVLKVDKDYSQNLEDKELTLINAKFIYEIKLHLNEDNIFFKFNDKEKELLLKAFVEGTGKLMLFPYVRHILHMLPLEAGINVPPLKPILVK